MSVLNNSVRLIGNLGRDVNVTEFAEGKKVARFSLATHDSWIDEASGDKITKTEWHNISAWGKTADAIEKYCKKGDKVAIEGKLIHRKNEKDGVTYYNTIVQIRDIVFLTPKFK